MKIQALLSSFAIACLLSGCAAWAQGGPGTFNRNGLEQVRWYHAPLEIQIVRGPTVRVWDGQNLQTQPGLSLPPATSASQLVQQSANGLPALPGQTPGGPAGPLTTAPLPVARFASNVPAHNMASQPSLPAGYSTGVNGRLLRQVSSRPVIASTQPAKVRHSFYSPPGHSYLGYGKSGNVPIRTEPQAALPAQPVDTSIHKYAGYQSYSSGAASSGVITSTSVSARLKRGTLLTGN